MTLRFPAPENPKADISDPFEGTAYRAIRQLARGGMGQIYLVEHRELGRECVAKVMHEKLAGEPQLLERVRIEAESLGTLNHPNIVSVNGFDTTSDGRPFIVMEYLRGRDLARTLASGQTFSPNEAIDLVLQACSALSAAHNIGIVHRDIKPENLFLHTESDGSTVLKVLDFGVVRIIPGVSPDTPTPLLQPTNTGFIIGTLRYVSPEGIAGNRVDYRADIYSLGVVLYRLLARRGPFDDDLSDEKLIAAALTEEPKPPSYFAPIRITTELDEVVLKALRKVPDERYQDIKAFSDALLQVKLVLADLNDSTEPVPIPLAPKQTLKSFSPAATISASRKRIERRTVLLNSMLFALVAAATTILVSFIVSTIRHASGAP